MEGERAPITVVGSSRPRRMSDNPVHAELDLLRSDTASLPRQPAKQPRYGLNGNAAKSAPPSPPVGRNPSFLSDSPHSVRYGTPTGQNGTRAAPPPAMLMDTPV